MQKNKEEISTVKHIYKWTVLAILCFTQITNISLFTGVGPIWSNLAIYYHTDTYNFNWLTNWYYFGPMVFSFLFNPLIIYNYGVSQILSCLFTATGYWILYLGQDDYLSGMFGFIFLGLGNSLFYQVPLQLSKLWFLPEERILSTSIGQYANNIGMLVGYVASSIYFYNIIDQNEVIEKYQAMILIDAVLATICLVSSFLTLKNPHKNSETIQLRDSIWLSIIKIFRVKESFMDLISFSSFFGLSWCYTMLFGYQQSLIGQTPLEITITNILYQIGALIAAIFCTIYLDKQSQRGLQQDYDKYIKYTINFGYLSLIIELLFMDSLPFSLTAIFNFFIGAGLGGTYSILLESLMEKHYPVQELAIASLLSGIACSISFVITMILAIPKFLEYGFQISCYFLIPPYCYIIVFYQTNYKRFEFES